MKTQQYFVTIARLRDDHPDGRWLCRGPFGEDDTFGEYLHTSEDPKEDNPIFLGGVEDVVRAIDSIPGGANDSSDVVRTEWTVDSTELPDAWIAHVTYFIKEPETD